MKNLFFCLILLLLAGNADLKASHLHTTTLKLDYERLIGTWRVKKSKPLQKVRIYKTGKRVLTTGATVKVNYQGKVEVGTLDRDPISTYPRIKYIKKMARGGRFQITWTLKPKFLVYKRSDLRGKIIEEKTFVRYKKKGGAVSPAVAKKSKQKFHIRGQLNNCTSCQNYIAVLTPIKGTSGISKRKNLEPSGQFLFSKLPKGSYKIRLFHQTIPARKLKISPREQTVQVAKGKVVKVLTFKVKE